MKFSAEIRVGIMAGFALILLAAFVFIIGDISFLSPTYDVVVKFHHVDGLLIGSKVAMSGVKVGKVESIDIRSGVVYVGIKVDQARRIPKNARLTIDTMGLMGEKLVGIEVPPEGEKGGFLNAGEEIDGVDPMRMTRLMSDGQQMMEKIRIAVESINDIVADPYFSKSIKNSAFSIEEAMANFNLTVRNIDNRLDEVQGKVERFLDHLDNVGFQASDMLGETRDSILEAVDNIRAFSSDLRGAGTENRTSIRNALRNFDEITRRLKKLASDIEGGGSTAADIRETMRNIRRSSENIRISTDEIRGVFEDGAVRQNLKETSFRINGVLQKADHFLGGFDSFQPRIGYVSRWNTESRQQLNDLDLSMDILGRELRMGVRNIGHGSEVDMQMVSDELLGKSLRARLGLIKSRISLGLDYSFMENSLTMLDVIDTYKTQVDTTSLYQFRENMQLMSRMENILSKDREYNVGIRYHF